MEGSASIRGQAVVVAVKGSLGPYGPRYASDGAAVGTV